MMTGEGPVYSRPVNAGEPDVALSLSTLLCLFETRREIEPGGTSSSTLFLRDEPRVGAEPDGVWRPFVLPELRLEAVLRGVVLVVDVSSSVNFARLAEAAGPLESVTFLFFTAATGVLCLVFGKTGLGSTVAARPPSEPVVAWSFAISPLMISTGDGDCSGSMMADSTLGGASCGPGENVFSAGSSADESSRSCLVSRIDLGAIFGEAIDIGT